MAQATGPTAECPLMGNTRVKMLEALESSFILCRFMQCEMLDCLQEDVQSTPLRRTRDVFNREISAGCPMVQLIHATASGLLLSLIKGTLAYDYHPDRRRQTYPEKGAGTYAVAPYIEGRDGKFLCRNELREIVNDLDQYLEAYTRLQVHQGDRSLMQPGERRLVRFANEVDQVFSPGWTPTKPTALRWVTSQVSFLGITALRESLHLRDQNSPDVTGTVWQEQAPIYVGCSNAMEACLPQHRPENGLSRTSKAPGLLLSLLKKRGHDVRVVAVPVVKTWTDDMLPCSEVVVTLLAQSLTEQGGLNVIDGGGRSDNSRSLASQEESRVEVMGQFPFVKENTDSTFQAINEINELVTILDDLVALAQTFETSKDELEDSAAEAQHVMDMLDNVNAALESQLEMAQKELDKLLSIRDSHLMIKDSVAQWKAYGDVYGYGARDNTKN
ncbi:hypothetical protein ColLi_05230 [Colletotrichum liriopes]|uniref:Uncharacterized protein n=1 Tax=Colletotrichum liriopes TaxID=708192 RepID=A0AA37LS53_9PEZI|nr:hypothetical protein ColLi_05230 [Colletotrichum liriopes]